MGLVLARRCVAAADSRGDLDLAGVSSFFLDALQQQQRQTT